MKLIFLLMIFSFSVVYAEPKTIDNSPKLCLETIYKKNFDAAPENAPKELNQLLSKCIAETKIKDFTHIKCSCIHPKDVDACIFKFISKYKFTKDEYFHAVAYHCERMLWSGFLSD